MHKVNAKNERAKRRYLTYLKEARQQSEATVDQTAASIRQFEVSTGCKDFAAFHIEQARKFKRDLETELSAHTGKPLSKATIRSRTKAVREFFLWLSHEPRYRSKLDHRDAAYFNVSANDERIATARRPKTVATVDQIRNVVLHMPSATEVHRRDRALIAIAALTGARDGALATLQLQNVDLDARKVFQDARNVSTKFRKSFTTWFFPVGTDFEEILRDWVDYLKQQKGFGPSDPLFPRTLIAFDQRNGFVASGVGCEAWRSTGPIREIYKRAFAAAGLKYSNPHTFRDTLTLLGSQICRTFEEIKAWSQNLGHDSPLTTLGSYGTVSDQRQEYVIKNLAGSTLEAEPLSSATIQRVLLHLQKTQAQ